MYFINICLKKGQNPMLLKKTKKLKNGRKKEENRILQPIPIEWSKEKDQIWEVRVKLNY